MSKIKSFFSADCPEGPFILFSHPHVMAILIIAGICIILYFLRDTLKSYYKIKHIRLSIALLLVLQEITFQIWNIMIGEWSIMWTLPLQLCSISALLTSVMLVSKSYRLYEIMYFLGIGGAVQAVLTPEIGIYTYPHFRYFQFFIGHGGIIIGCFFMTFVERYKPKLKSIYKTMVCLNIYAVAIGGFNKITGANYLFLCEKPLISSLMDYLGPWPWYIVSLESAAFIMFVLLYVPFIIDGFYKGSSRGRFLNT